MSHQATATRQRLREYARTNGENFNSVLVRFGLERLLYRIAVSEYADEFVLKGAALFLIWTGDLHRPTRDLDFLGHGDSSPDRILGPFVRG